jgi:hypothetical protein
MDSKRKLTSLLLPPSLGLTCEGCTSRPQPRLSALAPMQNLLDAAAADAVGHAAEDSALPAAGILLSRVELGREEAVHTSQPSWMLVSSEGLGERERERERESPCCIKSCMESIAPPPPSQWSATSLMQSIDPVIDRASSHKRYLHYHGPSR